ncbi:hypothetical protein BJX61DRAFT_540177 [Aspergillus egyptiacus]|nr:hypothetical protein BJX61DRAFT_540177 [Aspergillus egyptiacus]
MPTRQVRDINAGSGYGDLGRPLQQGFRHRSSAKCTAIFGCKTVERHRPAIFASKKPPATATREGLLSLRAELYKERRLGWSIINSLQDTNSLCIIPASKSTSTATMKLSLAIVPSLAVMAFALPGGILNARLACPAVQPGCTSLSDCEYCCVSPPADQECHIHQPAESCGANGGIVYHCEPH